MNQHTAKLVSVVMPAYNHEKYIGETISSVLSQTYSNLELIVIDDGSTDNTAGVIKSFDDHRIQYHYQDNHDAYNALNTGMERAGGDYISIINSDDVYISERLDICVNELQQNSASCIFTDITPIDDNSAELNDPGFGWNKWHQGNREVYLSSTDLYQAFLHGNFMVTTSNLVMTKECVIKVGNFSPIRYLHDYDYMFRILQAFPNGVHYLADQKLLKYRIHPGNTLSEAAILGREQDQELIRRSLLTILPQDKSKYINTAIDRLISLDRELQEVRQESTNPSNEPVVRDRSRLKDILRRIRTRG